MKRYAIAMMMIGAAGIAAPGLATAAQAQSQSQQVQKTPKDWSYEIRDGKRVPKGKRTVNPDGSWREEIRRGDCVVIKEKSAQGVYKETRRCD